MKLVCTVAVVNRLLPTVSVKSQHKHVKSTLALCRHPKNKTEFMVILFTQQNKTGTKYKLNENVSAVLTRFINEGKATIQFREPAHDFFVNGDVIQLKGFLHLMRRALEKKITEKELTMSSLSCTPVRQKDIPPKKLVITKRSEIPTHGFPRTLEVLFINEITLCKLCIGVLQLQKLRVLDISNNFIEYLPTELNRLPLADLNVSKNVLCNSQFKQWDWIGGTLCKTLKRLDLSKNNLLYIPQTFVKLQALNYVNLEKNLLTSLPTGIGNIRNLRSLTLCNNKLTQVPGSMKRLHLEFLDISNNNFKPISVAAFFPKTLPVCTLKECSARKVLQAKLPYNAATLPYTLVDYLDYSVFYCVCGRPCFEVHLHHTNVLMLSTITQKLVSNMYDTIDANYIPMDCYYCSMRCLRRLTHHPI